MEDGDDDFGDLYADVEVEATSAMNIVAPQLQCVGDGTGKDNVDKDDRENDGIDDDVDDEEDDDDDLDIVLNVDNDSIRHGEDFTIRYNTNFRSRDLDDEDDDNFGTEEFTGGKDVSKLNSQYKYRKSQLEACGNDLKGSGCEASNYLSHEDDGCCQRMGSRSMGPQCGQRFSLPRSRSILDVNIDIFEHKPWKHPGADITDYFNFGFNEDSWKLYCNQVDEYRHRGHMSTGIPASETVQIMEKKEFKDRLEHEIASCGDWLKTDSRQWKGQAIQVEGSIYERQSSMDVRHRPDRDSDVIQITLLDPEHCSGSVKEGSCHLDSSVPEASNHGDVSGNDGTDHLSFGSAREDESVDGNHLEIDNYAPTRSSNRRTSSKPERRGSKSHEIHQSSDGSGGPNEAIRNSSDTKGRTGEDPCTTDPSMLVAESSEAEKSPANHNKMFKNGGCIDRRRSYSLERRPSSMSYRQPVKAGYHHWGSKREDEERELSENRYHARHTNPMYNNKNRGDSKRKRHDEHDDQRKYGEFKYHARCYSPTYNRTHKDFKPKLHHENDDIWLRRPVDKSKPGDYSCHRRHSSPIYNRGTCRVSKLEDHNEYEHSPDIDGRYERSHGYNSYDEEIVSHLKKLELPSDYYDERFPGDESRDTLARDLHCEGYERLGAEMNRSVFSNAEVEEYYGERRRYTEDDKTMARDWYCNESELAVEDVDFFSSHAFRWQKSRSPPYLKYNRGALWKRNEEDLQFRNKDEDDYFLGRECYEDIEENYRSITYNRDKRDDFECRHAERVTYTRWEFRGPGENNRRFGSPYTEINNHWPKRDGHSFESQSSEESYINNGRGVGNVMPRDALYRRRGTYRGQSTERFRLDGSLGVYSESFDREDYAIDINDHDDIGRRRHHWQSEMQWKEDEIMLRHEDAELCSERAPFSFKKVSRHKRFISEHEPDHVESIDDHHVEGRRYNKFEGTLNVTHGGNHKWIFKGGLDSHLIDGSDHEEGRYKQTKELFNGNKRSKTHAEIHKQPSLSCRNSLERQMVVRDVKALDGRIDRMSSEKHEKGEQIKFDSSCPNDKGDRDAEPKVNNKGLDIKEGQILAKDENIRASVNDVKKFDNQKGKSVVNNPRILEAMEKMEKRRARFNDTVTADRKHSDDFMNPTVVDLVHEKDTGKQLRPARKRRWGGI